MDTNRVKVRGGLDPVEANRRLEFYKRVLEVKQDIESALNAVSNEDEEFEITEHPKGNFVDAENVSNFEED